MSEEYNGMNVWKQQLEFMLQKHSIAELIIVERKNKDDVEKKREQLRSLVGTRYRELMEAADMIIEMRKPAHEFKEFICNFRKLHDPFNTHVKQKDPTGSHLELKSLCMSRLLIGSVNTMEAILCSEEYVIGSLSYHFFVAIKDKLVISSESNTFISKEGIEQKENAILQYQSRITSEIKRKLKIDSTEKQTVIEYLCALFICEKLTPENLLKQFLGIRLDALNDICVFDGHVTAVEQFQRIVNLYVTTILSANSFLENVSTLEEMIRRKISEFLLNFVYDNDFVNYYCEEFVSALEKLGCVSPSAESYISILREWNMKVLPCLKQTSQRILLSVTSAAQLCSIRDAIVKLAKTADTKNQDLMSLINYPVDIWSEIFLSQFNNRIYEMVEHSWDTFGKELSLHLNDEMSNFAASPMKRKECDYDNYVWLSIESSMVEQVESINYTAKITKMQILFQRILKTVSDNLSDLQNWGSSLSQLNAKNRAACVASLQNFAALYEKNLNVSSNDASDLQFLAAYLCRFTKFLFDNIEELCHIIGDDENTKKTINGIFRNMYTVALALWIKSLTVNFENRLKLYFDNSDYWVSLSLKLSVPEKYPSIGLLNTLEEVYYSVMSYGTMDIDFVVLPMLMRNIKSSFTSLVYEFAASHGNSLSECGIHQFWFDVEFARYILNIERENIRLPSEISIKVKDLEQQIKDAATKVHINYEMLFLMLNCQNDALSKMASYSEYAVPALSEKNFIDICRAGKKISLISPGSMESLSALGEKDSKYWALVSKSPISQSNSRRVDRSHRDGSFRNLAADVASPALSSISNKFGAAQLKMFNTFFN